MDVPLSKFFLKESVWHHVFCDSSRCYTWGLHSSTTALMKFDTFSNFDNKMCTGTTFLDLTKAFDLVYNYLLLDQSFAVGLSNMSLLWFNSYFHYRCQGLLFRVSLFNFTAINEDIPQGSTLGPIVFSISIDDLPNCCSKFNVHLYADDAIIYCSKPSITEINISLQQDFDSIQCWMNS